MTFRQELIRRATARRARIVLAEGEDPRVRAAASRMRGEAIAEPILIGGPDGVTPAADPRLQRVAEFLRSRRPDKVHDGAVGEGEHAVAIEHHVERRAHE